MMSNYIPQSVEDLNRLTIRVENAGYQELEDHSCVSTKVKVEVIFRNHKDRLLGVLSKYDTVFGCVAWLTDGDVLDALQNKRVSIVVQKEDFIRPDSGRHAQWKETLRAKCERIDCQASQYHMPDPLNKMSVCGSPEFWGVRCVGNHNQDSKPAFPSMHNKFLVLTNWANWEEALRNGRLSKNSCVWTGSNNLSRNANFSFENALIIHDARIVRAYLNEYAQIMALSESLDWESDWCFPEERIGT